MSIGHVLLVFWVLLNGLGEAIGPIGQCTDPRDTQLRIESCTKVIEQREFSFRDKAIAFSNRGVTYQDQGIFSRAFADLDRAIVDLSEVLRQNPQDVYALASRGRAYRAQGSFSLAISDYDNAIGLNPYNADIYNSRCWARALRGVDLDIARIDCDTALKLSNYDPVYLDSRGLAGIKQGRFADSWVDYDKALRRVPGTAHYLYGRGLAALRLGHSKEGNDDILEATKLDASIAQRYRRHGVVP